MYAPRSARHGLIRLVARPVSVNGTSRRSIATDTDVDKARQYCVNQLRHGDYDAYLIRNFLPPSARDTYDAIRTLNLELARLPESVSSPTIGQLRIQFWRDNINRIFASTSSGTPSDPPREPISILLHRAISRLHERAASSVDRSYAATTTSMKFWLLRLINTRAKHMDNRPFPSLSALEEYGENTYATLIYITLASMPIQSVHLDHLASHIGKAAGIVATLRGIPVLAAPPRPIKTPQGLEALGSGQRGHQALLLPLDTMATAGASEEDVFRNGPRAKGLQDAVFEAATRANDHLITAREMWKDIKAGREPGHEYEYGAEEQHAYEEEAETSGDAHRGFGVLLEAVPPQDFLMRLEAADFDPFKVKASWKLPWSLWRASRGMKI